MVSVWFSLTEAEVAVWLTDPLYVVTFKPRLWENEVVIFSLVKLQISFKPHTFMLKPDIYSYLGNIHV